MAGVTTRIVFLRGINVGGHRKVPMAELRAALADDGFDPVHSYIQSGNVVVGTDDDDRTVEMRFGAILAATFGLDDVSVISMLPDRLEVARVASAREFPDDGSDPGDHARRTHVVFLDVAPERSSRSALDPDDFAPDRFVLEVHDGVAELHVSYAHGAGTSKLTIDRIERAFGVTATARNLNTVERMRALAGT
jgi:uncharacterized protein (DUF1697 family)